MDTDISGLLLGLEPLAGKHAENWCIGGVLPGVFYFSSFLSS
jgi:hypothetical protein